MENTKLKQRLQKLASEAIEQEDSDNDDNDSVENLVGCGTHPHHRTKTHAHAVKALRELGFHKEAKMLGSGYIGGGLIDNTPNFSQMNGGRKSKSQVHVSHTGRQPSAYNEYIATHLASHKKRAVEAFNAGRLNSQFKEAQKRAISEGKRIPSAAQFVNQYAFSLTAEAYRG